MAKVSVEFGLVALAHNLRKYARVQTLSNPITAEPVAVKIQIRDEIMGSCAFGNCFHKNTLL